MTKLIAKILLGLVALYVCFIVGINALLLPAIGLRLGNLAPNVAAVRYDKAWMWTPFRVHANNFYFRYQDGMIQMEITADKAALTWKPLALITARTFRGDDIDGDNIVLKLRQRLDAPDVTKSKLAKLPPIEGWESPLRHEKPQPIPDDDSQYKLIAVDLRHMNGHLKEVWVDEYRFEGDIAVSGGFYYKPMRKIRVDDVTLSVKDGVLSLGEGPFADNIEAQIHAQVDEMDIHHFQQAALAGADLDLKLSAHVKQVSFLDYYLKDVPQVRLREGAGVLSADVHVQRGVIQPKSRFGLDTKKVSVVLPYFTASGAGKIRWEAEEKNIWLKVGVTDIVLVQQSDGKAYLRGPQLNVTAVTHGRDLSKQLGLDLVIDLPSAESSDLSFLSNFIPDGAGVKVTKGKGKVSGNLEINARTNHGRGILDIDATGIELWQRNAKLSGRVKVRGKLVDLNMKTGMANLSGSSLDLDDMAVEVGGSRHDKYWIHVQTAACVVKPKKDVLWYAELSVNMKNLFPIMKAVSQSVEIPWIVQAFSSLNDLQAETGLVIRPHAIELHKLHAMSSILDVQGNMQIIEGPPGKMQDPFGAILVRFGAIRAAVELNGKRSRAILAGAEPWYNANPWGPSTGKASPPAK